MATYENSKPRFVREWYNDLKAQNKQAPNPELQDFDFTDSDSDQSEEHLCSINIDQEYLSIRRHMAKQAEAKTNF